MSAPPVTNANPSAVQVWTGPREVIRIGDFDRSKVNMLIPGAMTVQLNEFLIPVKREVYLDPDPENGDVYPISQEKRGDRWVAKELGIAAVGLMTLSNNAGILDVPQASGRVDGGRDPGVCTYRATMVMRMPDGQWIPKTRECTVKMATVAKEITALKTAKARQYSWSAAKLEAEIAKELLLKEKFLERLAETGAKTRCIRALLSIRTKYTPAQIARPFVLAAVVLDMSSPEMRQMALLQASAAIPAVFGPGPETIEHAPRQLVSGPPADIEDPDPEASELTRDELAGQLGMAASDDDDDQDDAHDAEFREITRTQDAQEAVATGRADATTGEVLPDWLSDTPTTADRPGLVDRLTAIAEESQGDDKATPEQLDAIKGRLRDVTAPMPALVLKAAFGKSKLAEITQRQATAILNQGKAIGWDALCAEWSRVATELEASEPAS